MKNSVFQIKRPTLFFSFLFDLRPVHTLLTKNVHNTVEKFSYSSKLKLYIFFCCLGFFLLCHISSLIIKEERCVFLSAFRIYIIMDSIRKPLKKSVVRSLRPLPRSYWYLFGEWKFSPKQKIIFHYSSPY